MCGIAGALDLTGQREFSPARLLAMTGAIAHRGPDDEQIHCEPGVALGARRLSIVDLAGGRQPIANEAGDVWVCDIDKGRQRLHLDGLPRSTGYLAFGPEGRLLASREGDNSVRLWDVATG